MKVRCWGARGSVPVSGPEYARYGGDTTCIEVRSKNDEILVIDAGTGIRRLGCALLEQGRLDLTLLFTHTHWDHVLGLPFFKLLYDPKAWIRLYGCPGLQGNITKLLSRVMSPPLFPVPFASLPSRLEGLTWEEESIQVDTLTVTRIALSHPNLGAGYRVEEDGKSFVFLTDNELAQHHRGGRSFDEYAAFCRDADLLLHDAEYTPEEYPARRGWGHSHFGDVALLAKAAEVKVLGLTHHNQERTDEGVDEVLRRCREVLAGPGPRCLAVSQYSEFAL
ncbi:MAG: MBL fold metallo-hydrolase [Proteobacteria bacterium]|nr:MBL fold metallo-hydrolase [Pseudomonadota bacterium]MBU1594977.1 MBL fold metallo-hydrolase [Pseudomonadota bacterium]